MTLNVELLDRTLAHIEAHPEEWDQGAWRCETGLCFAGTAAVLSGAKWLHPLGHQQDHWVRGRGSQQSEPAAWRAQRLLGLDEDQADELFAAHNTLDDLRRIVADLKAAAL